MTKIDAEIWDAYQEYSRVKNEIRKLAAEIDKQLMVAGIEANEARFSKAHVRQLEYAKTLIALGVNAITIKAEILGRDILCYRIEEFEDGRWYIRREHADLHTILSLFGVIQQTTLNPIRIIRILQSDVETFTPEVEVNYG